MLIIDITSLYMHFMHLYLQLCSHLMSVISHFEYIFRKCINKSSFKNLNNDKSNNKSIDFNFYYNSNMTYQNC